MKRLLAVSALLLGTASVLCGQSKDTGLDWRQLTVGEKTMYVLGWIDGKTEGIWSTIRVLDPNLHRQGMKALENPRLKPLNRTVKVGELVTGLDEFYKEYKNLPISVRSAIAVVRDQLTGANITEEYLQRLRRAETQQP
jgi:hypothetical protein